MQHIIGFISNSISTIISLCKIAVYSKWFAQLYKAENPKKGLVILGNGPSLKYNLTHDVELLLTKDKLCVNGFAIAADYERLKPEYYLIADLAFWIDNPIERVKIFRNNVVEAINAKTTWPLILFLPYEAQKSRFLKTAFASNSNISVKYFNKTTVKGFRSFCNHCYRLGLGIPRPQNVLVPSLILGLNMGYQKLYLLGADHSWHENLIVSSENLLCLKDPHFYDDGTKLIPLLNEKGQQSFMHEQFQSLFITFRNYHYINKYANYCKSNIYNASEKSYIDAFQRIKLS
jgi:hypothetical protein